MPVNFDLNHLGSIFIDLENNEDGFSNIPDCGPIVAGFPSPGLDYNDDDFDLESFLFASSYKKVIFHVSGDSMIEAGIHDGDIAIVEKGRSAKVGDIIVAFVDGKYTVKFLKRDSNENFYLQPANKDFPDIYPEENLQIFGVVTSIIRKYH